MPQGWRDAARGRALWVGCVDASKVSLEYEGGILPFSLAGPPLWKRVSLAFSFSTRQFVSLATLLLALTGPLSLGAPKAMAEAGLTLKTPAKIAMVIYGPTYDGGWSMAFNEARLRMQDTLGMPIAYVDRLDENDARVIVAVERFIADGHNIIIGTANDFSGIFAKLADRFPDVAFLNAAGTTNGPNLQSFYGRSFESQYLCGMLAGLKSQHGKLGFVAAKELAVVNWAVNGFSMGVRKTHPGSVVKTRFTGNWADPRAEQLAARDLINQGADVLGQHVDTPTPQLTAQAMLAFSTGHHRDQSNLTPDTTLCSSIWVWDRYLVPEIRKIMAGGWVPAPHGALPDFKNGPADISINEELVPTAWIEKVMAVRQLLIEGKQIFTGPLKDNQGVVRLAEGEPISPQDLWHMDWLVEGAVRAESHDIRTGEDKDDEDDEDDDEME